ncbi:MAG: cytidylate kinase family protein [Nanoarchaeota archaeon]|nr:cytidylate kinase family protein [Nanoarchaeota archaeon]
MVKISIFGLAGTGTSSTAKELSIRHDLEFVSSGNMFRESAKSRNLSLMEFSRLCLKDESVDKELDKKVADFGSKNDNFVIDSRLAWYFIPDSVKIKLVCDSDVRFARISERDKIDIDEAIIKTLAREESEVNRYFNYYGIVDYSLDSNFDLIINTTSTSLLDVCDLIENYLKRKGFLEDN